MLGGHEVVGVSGSSEQLDWTIPVEESKLSDRVMRRTKEDRLALTASRLECDLYVPTHPGVISVAVEAAEKSGSTVLVRPTWSRPGHTDLISRAPSEAQLSVPASGCIPQLHTPGYSTPRPTAREGTIFVAYRKTERNPGRYIEAALSRAGLDVHHIDRIDWTHIGPQAKAVVVVESPLPALAVSGTNPGVPVVFWVHHGEHHLDANLRLQRRYGAHVVMLAHSWHLAHQFTGLVERLPFGVASELIAPGFVPHRERRWDVAFVGESDRSRYSRRFEILERIERRLGRDRVAIQTGIDPPQMARLYRDARIVIDHAAGRHLPVTMRVFEATGAGALLMTSGGPGLELLFEPGTDFQPMAFDPGEQVAELIQGGTETTAANGHASAWRRHTYDVRVAELLITVDRMRDEGVEPPGPTKRGAGLAGVAELFVDAQRVLDLGGDVVNRLPGREVWPYEEAEERAEPGTFHMAVVSSSDESKQVRAVAASRHVVVCPRDLAGSLETLVGESHGDFHRYDLEDGTALVFGSSGYRVSNAPDPAGAG